MPASQIEVLNRARDLAAELTARSTPVKAGTLRSIVADFMSAPEPDPAKLRRTLRLLKEGSGGHLARSGNFPDQVLVAIAVLDGVLEGDDLTPQELKTLFGWTARLLMIRSERRGSGAPKRTPRRDAVGPRGGDRRPPERKPRPAAKVKLSPVKKSSLDALARMKAELAKKESGES